MIDKSREKREKGKDIERSDSKDWIKVKRRERRNYSRDIVG